MPTSRSFRIHSLSSEDVALMRAMLTTFGKAFGEAETYCGAQPSSSYLERLLGSEHFFALAALKNGKVVGGITAYEFKKFEQERSEFYIYDLAVAAAHRRQGIATALILEVKKIAVTRKAHVLIVQADAGDAPAEALYSKLGKREEVLHFDIALTD